jgi:hypothetical protein
MNRFVKSRSRFSVFLISFCVLALFNDGANLTDLFSDTSTIHFDEGDGLQGAEQLITSGGAPGQGGFFFTLLHQRVASEQHPVSARRVILDQDSPSLAAVSIVSSPSFTLNITEEKTHYRSALLDESIFLQDCSLLL